MKTEYSLFCMYDSDLEAFIPSSLGCFLTEKQYIQSVVLGMLRSDKEEVASKIRSLRFYKVATFDVDKVPSDVQELTNDVVAMYKEGLKEKEKGNENAQQVTL